MSERVKRRLRLYALSAQEMLEAFLAPESAVEITFVEGVPAGAKVLGVNYDYQRSSFVFTVEHESFSEVPDGQMMPVSDHRLYARRIVLQKREDGAYDLPDHLKPASWRDRPPLA